MTALEIADAIREAIRRRILGLEIGQASERGGVIEPGASFDMTDPDGKTWRVIVARQR